MARITCEVEYGTDTNEETNREQDCVIVTCSECEHCEQSWGHSDASIKRCLVLLRENCPEGQKNFYVEED